MPSSKAPAYNKIDRNTVWIAPGKVPELGLVPELTFPFRVYAIQCQAPHGDMGPYIYTGIAHASIIGDRIKGHWKGGATHFTDEHRPKQILLVHPAANLAVESYVFHAFLSLQCSGRVRTLGGWTQTSADPSPLALQQFEQERRNLSCRCFNCGAGSHVAKDCKKPLEGITYPCPQCSAQIVISSRGQTQPVTKPSAKSSGGHSAAPPPLTTESAGSKRQARPASTAPAAKVPKVGASPSSHHGMVVQVCGKLYCGLSWFLGQSNPPPKVCLRVREECAEGALEMQGGDLRTLVSYGFAGQPSEELPPLMPGRERLPAAFQPTAITTDRCIVKLRKARQSITCANRQVLWPVSSLEKLLANKKK